MVDSFFAFYEIKEYSIIRDLHQQYHYRYQLEILKHLPGPCPLLKCYIKKVDVFTLNRNGLKFGQKAFT